MEKPYSRNYRSQPDYELVRRDEEEEGNDNNTMNIPNHSHHDDSSHSPSFSDTGLEFEDQETLYSNPNEPNHPSLSTRYKKRESSIVMALRLFTIFALYIASSVTVPLLTKIMYEGVFNRHHIDIIFNSSMFTTWLYLTLSFTMGVILGEIGKVIKPIGTFFPPYTVEFSMIKKLFPLAVLYLASHLANFYFLAYVDLPYFQTITSLTIPLHLLLTHTRDTNNSTSHLPPSVLLAGIIVTVGFLLGSTADVDVTLGSWGLGVMACLLHTATNRYCKRMVGYVNGDWWSLHHYLNSISIVIGFLLLALSGELVNLAYSSPYSDPFAWLVVFNIGLLFFLHQCTHLLFGQWVTPRSPLFTAIAYLFQAWLLAYLAINIHVLDPSPQSLTGLNLTILGIGLIGYLHPHPPFLPTVGHPNTTTTNTQPQYRGSAC